MNHGWRRFAVLIGVIVGLGILLLSLVAIGDILTMKAHGQSCVTNAQVTLAGNLRGSNGIPTSNAILTLTPSQQGYIAGCGVNIATNSTCATSTDGSVVGIQNPQTATVNTTSGGGTLPSGTYYTEYAWYDAAGHVTLVSPETRTTLSVTGSLVVNPPSSGIPSLAVGMDVYIGTSSGGENLQGQTTGSASFIQSTAPVSFPPPGSTNTTLCQIIANDAIWPTGTGYNVTLVNVAGNPIPNYPMQWQLLGGGTTINLSNGLPYYHGVVFYPVPLLASPANHGTQSISGGLSFGGYFIYNAGRIGLGTATPAWAVDAEGSGPNGVFNAATGYLINGAGGSLGNCLASDGLFFDTSLPCGQFNQTIQLAGTAKPQEPIINFAAGLSVVDDPTHTRTNVSLLATKAVLSLPATTVSPNTCSSPVTASLPGTVPTSTFSTAFATNPTAATGWGANGGLVVELWPDASPDILDWAICNQTGSSITPTAITLNVGLN